MLLQGIPEARTRHWCCPFSCVCCWKVSDVSASRELPGDLYLHSWPSNIPLSCRTKEIFALPMVSDMWQCSQDIKGATVRVVAIAPLGINETKLYQNEFERPLAQSKHNLKGPGCSLIPWEEHPSFCHETASECKSFLRKHWKHELNVPDAVLPDCFSGLWGFSLGGITSVQFLSRGH